MEVHCWNLNHEYLFGYMCFLYNNKYYHYYFPIGIYSLQVFYNSANVRQIDVPSFSGSFGILPAHVPSLAVLKPGVLTVFEGDGTSKKFFVSSGIVTINEDSSGKILWFKISPFANIIEKYCWKH